MCLCVRLLGNLLICRALLRSIGISWLNRWAKSQSPIWQELAVCSVEDWQTWVMIRFFCCIVVLLTSSVTGRGVRLTKNGFGSFLQKKKQRFSVQFWFYQINCGFVFFWFRFFQCVTFNVYALSTECFTLYSSVDAIFHLHINGMTLEMTYFHAELVQLILSAEVTQN